MRKHLKNCHFEGIYLGEEVDTSLVSVKNFVQ